MSRSKYLRVRVTEEELSQLRKDSKVWPTWWSLSDYVRHLLNTHPERQKAKVKK